MDSSVKNACFDDIGHTVLDSDKKVTVKTISNNWDITLKDAAAVLEEWISKNPKGNLTKEYLVKGIDQNGNGVITIVPDMKLDKIQKKLQNFSKILHSIELASESSTKKLVVPEYDEVKMINLHIQSEERDYDIVPVVAEERIIISSGPSKLPTLVEKKKEVSISSMFAGSGKKTNTDNDSEDSKMDSSPVEAKKLTVYPKKELRTPKKTEDTTNTKESPKTKKDSKKPPPKNSIASFFIQAGNKSKPAATTVSATQSVKLDSPKRVNNEVKSPELKRSETLKKPESEKTSPEKTSSKSIKSEMVTPKKKESKTDTLKRSISAICDSDNSEDEIPTTPQAKKQPKSKRTKSKQNGNAKKRTRIIQNESSDENDDVAKKNGKSSDIENIEVAEKSPEIKPSNKRTQNGDNSSGRRRKAKRTVTRTYEDSDGFFKTVKEVEEYSCSDDDVQMEPIKSPIIQNKKTDKTTNTKRSPTKPTPKKNEKPATKQGSIMSFFTKK